MRRTLWHDLSCIPYTTPMLDTCNGDCNVCYNTNMKLNLMLTFFEETHFCNFKTKKKNTKIKKLKKKIIFE